MSELPESTGPIVGIDLGTTNSVVAAIVGGKPKVFPIDGQPTMPSVVGVTAEGKLVTGVTAYNQLAAFPDRTIASIKRKMGSMDPVAVGEQSYTSPEISAMVLRRLREVASSAMGRDVDQAVITVPAFFDEPQRQATRQAGELAGWRVRRIINEPTAATLVYHAGTEDQKHIAVYDFGGGTFDVSIVRMEAGVTEVLASQGDTQLGGDDIDHVMLDRMAETFQETHGIDFRKNPQAKFRVLQACERAKRKLSEAETVTIAEEFIEEKDGEALHLNASISREEFNEWVEPLIDRTIECFATALRDASMSIQRIDDIVLVGGSTRIPLVAQRLREEFATEPSRSVDPDLAVAFGAAVQAAKLEGQDVGAVLVDVATHTLGIKAMSGMSFDGPEFRFVPILRRGTPLPARYEEAFSKNHDEQKKAIIEVLQGEHPDPDRNVAIGEFDLDLRGTDSSHRKIVVRFELTLDGVLQVNAMQPASGTTKALTIDNPLTQFAAEDRDAARQRLESMFVPSDEQPDADSSTQHDATSAANLVDMIAEQHPKTAKLLQRADSLRSKMNDEDAGELESLRQSIAAAIESGDSGEIKDLTADLDDLLFYVQ